MARPSAETIRRAEQTWIHQIQAAKETIIRGLPVDVREKAEAQARHAVTTKAGIEELFSQLTAAQEDAARKREDLAGADAEVRRVETMIELRFNACREETFDRYGSPQREFATRVLKPLDAWVTSEAEALLPDPRIAALTSLEKRIRAALAGLSISGERMEAFAEEVEKAITLR